MDVTIVSLDDCARASCEAVELRHREDERTLFAKIPATADLAHGDALGFPCVDGRFRLFEITSRRLNEPEGTWEISAVEKAVRELMDEPVEELRARDITARAYAERILANTRFVLGTVDTVTGSASAYYESAWSALEGLADGYGMTVIPYYEFANGLVSARKVDIVQTIGQDRGRLFELGDDMDGIAVTFDDSAVKTALYGRGRGVEIGTEADGLTYGRRLDFADAVWSTEDGDPADKPEGQEWVGDQEALAAFGRNGRHRFGFAIFEDETDPEKLLQRTWAQLQKQKEPALSVTASVVDTERLMGRSHEAVRLGDQVTVRIASRGLDLTARVTQIERDYLKPEATKITVANASFTDKSASRIMQRVQETVADYSARSGAIDRAGAAFDLTGAMDVMNNQILSTSGHWRTDPDTGAILMESADGTKAMRLTGAGWQIASGKEGGAWVWRTAATGSGLVADEITSGVLNAGLVTVGGTGTTMTGTSLTVAHPEISQTARTVLDAYGLKMMNGGQVIGGIVNTGGGYASAVQKLYNPAANTVEVDIAPGVYADEEDGLQFVYGGNNAATLTFFTNENNQGGLRLRTGTGSQLYMPPGSVSLKVGGAMTGITMDSNGAIYFSFRHSSEGWLNVPIQWFYDSIAGN